MHPFLMCFTISDPWFRYQAVMYIWHAVHGLTQLMIGLLTMYVPSCAPINMTIQGKISGMAIILVAAAHPIRSQESSQIMLTMASH